MHPLCNMNTMRVSWVIPELGHERTEVRCVVGRCMTKITDFNMIYIHTNLMKHCTYYKHCDSYSIHAVVLNCVQIISILHLECTLGCILSKSGSLKRKLLNKVVSLGLRYHV